MRDKPIAWIILWATATQLGLPAILIESTHAASRKITVSSRSDDAEEAGPETDPQTLAAMVGGSPGGDVSTGSSDLELSHDRSFQIVGIRFNGVGIPRGARVENAQIQFVCDEINDSYPAKLTIKAEATNSAQTFTKQRHDISSRATTKASVPWSPEDWDTVGEAGRKQLSPDLSELVQEVVDRPGWTAGNSIAFLISGKGLHIAGAVDGGKPAALHLQWQAHKYGIQLTQPNREATEKDQQINLAVQLSTPAQAPIDVDYEFVDLTADAAIDYEAKTRGTLTFEPGVSTQIIPVKIVDDRTPEKTEQFKIVLSRVDGRDLDAGIDGHAETVVTIVDSSPRVAFGTDDSIGEEADGAAAVAVTLTKPWNRAVTVDYSTLPDQTTADKHDFALRGNGTLTFQPGETSKQVRLAVRDDSREERTEKIALVLSGATNALLGPRTQHVHRIAASDTSTDWAMWRYDAGRTAATPVPLPSDLKLQWVLSLPQLEPAWPPGDGAVTGTEDMRVSDGRQRRLTFDVAYAPIVVGKAMYVGSSYDDCLRAYDTETGKEKWHFYTDAPIRFAPAAANERLYVASDDGYLYCLSAKTGDLHWKFRGAPSGRNALGNKRLGSIWPARGGPVIMDGTVYFAAGIWPFMGTLVYALDANTGEEVWVNDGSAFNFMQSPHSGAWSFNAIAPQGYLAANHETLIVPNGRAVGAAFDRKTGKLEYFRFGDNNRNGTAHAAILEDYWQGSCALFNTEDGSVARKMLDGAVLTNSSFYESLVKNILDPGPSGVRARHSSDLSVKWEYTGKMHTQVFCKAGSVVYAGGPGQVVALKDLGDSFEVVWESAITGTPASMLAGDSKLIVVTQEGHIHCFGAGNSSVPLPTARAKESQWPGQDEWTAKAQETVTIAGQRDGYCLVLGVGTGRLMEELANQYPDMRVIGLDPDAEKIKTLRTRWGKLNIPHQRLSALVGDIVSAQLPPYLANLVVSEDITSAGTAHGSAFVEKVFYSLRPYGGRVCVDADLRSLFRSGVDASGLANAEVRREGQHTILERVGALPGAADWTHQYADAANTVMSKDQLVRAPMGLLWYGGSSNKQILPRHRHGPSEHVVGGRLFIEGPDLIRAVDVYTGRLLWQADLPGLGHAFAKFPIFRANEAHEPGANHMGSNFATAPDGVYVAYGKQCLRLDPATGKTIAKFTAPNGGTFAQVKYWEHMLVAAIDPLQFDDKPAGEETWNDTCSRHIVVLDRYSGKILWQRTAENAFHHNSIIVGDGLVFCIDRLPPGQEDKLRRRGLSASQLGKQYKLLALDAGSGYVVWSTDQDIFGTWLGYSAKEGLLIQSGRRSPDMISGEPSGRIITYRAKDGEVLWDKEEDVDDGPYLLAHGIIYMQNSQYSPSNAVNMLNGEEVMTTHPLTGKRVPWHFMRNKGCSSVVGCENLLTFRSGAAAYYDLTTNGGIGHFGGFKSGCSSNLIPANGVLSAPDYTRSCNCSYQNQTSLALIHMPEVETWTHGAADRPDGPIQRAGVNFGAPGDRVSKAGTLWMEFPVPKYGDSPGDGFTYPNLDISTTPKQVETFRHHSSRFEGPEPRWVAASGAIGIRKVTVNLGGEQTRAFRVRLFFAEPKAIAANQRVFSVHLQGRQVLSDFDIIDAAGGPRRTVVREFPNVQVTDKLSVKLVPTDGAPVQEPLLCGIEMIAESR